MLYTLPAQLVLAAACVLASPVQLPSLLPRDGDLTSRVEAAFKPYLNVVDGCSPVAAVDTDGHTNDGLSSESTDNKDCFNPGVPGPVYARYFENKSPGDFSGSDALMYAWYFPKSTGDKKSHKHDWQIVVLWLMRTQTANPDPLASYAVADVSVSTPRGYKTGVSPRLSHGSDPLGIFYVQSGLDADHIHNEATAFNSSLVPWEAFTPQAQHALNDKQALGGYSAPFSDAPAKSGRSKTQFQDHLKAAWDSMRKA